MNVNILTVMSTIQMGVSGRIWQNGGADLDAFDANTRGRVVPNYSEVVSYVTTAIADKASTNDVQIAPVFSEWTILRAGVDVTAQVPQPVFSREQGEWWVGSSHISTDSTADGATGGAEVDLNLTWEAFVGSTYDTIRYTATRSFVGYALGSQTDKVLASTNLQTGVSAEVVTNIVHDIAQVPGNYAAVSNAAMSAMNTAAGLVNGSIAADKAITAESAEQSLTAETLTPANPSQKPRDAEEIFAQIDASTETNAALTVALTTRPTKAQIEAGWWSEWVCEPSDVELHWVGGGQTIGWLPLKNGVDVGAVKGNAESSILSWSSGQGESDFDITATRHRVAAPVPVKPADIGAQPLMTFDITPTAGSTNPVTSGGVKTALNSKANTNDVQLTPVYGEMPSGFSEWTVTPATYEGYPIIVRETPVGDVVVYTAVANGRSIDAIEGSYTALSVAWASYGITATRTAIYPIIGYTLGSQTDKVLSSTNSIPTKMSQLNNDVLSLAGETFDFSSNNALQEGVLNCLDKLGATITNPPSGFVKTNGVWRYVQP